VSDPHRVAHLADLQAYVMKARRRSRPIRRPAPREIRPIDPPLR
jgi:hypothetical protein